MARLATQVLSNDGDPIYCHRVTGARGDTFLFKSDEELFYARQTQIAVYVRGTIASTRKQSDGSYANNLGREDGLRSGGKTSFEHIQERGIVSAPAGAFKFEVITDDVLYYCLEHKDKLLTAADWTVFRASFDLPAGSFAFLAEGEAVVGGTLVTAPRLIYAGLEIVQIEAVGPIYGVTTRLP
jgi:hypothetical protein